jgi:hypothetical protein
MKGGARPGAGRRKGQKDVKPRKGTEAHQEKEQIQQLLSLGIKAKAKFYQEFLFRVSRGEKLTLTEKRMMNALGDDLKKGIDGEKEEPDPVGEEIVDASGFLRAVWNNPKIDMALRIRAAEVAVRGAGERVGKKGEKVERAKEAGRGRFATAAPPKLAVVGK